MLQLPHVIEVSFGVWRFRGLRRDPAPDCKTPLDHTSPTFQMPTRYRIAIWIYLEVPAITSARFLRRARGCLHPTVQKVEGRESTLRNWSSTSMSNQADAHLSFDLHPKQRQRLPTSSTLNSRA